MECLMFKEKHKIRMYTDTNTSEDEEKILERDLEEILTWKTKEKEEEEEEEISTTEDEIVQTEEMEITITEEEEILTSEEEEILITEEEEDQSPITEEEEATKIKEEISKTEEEKSLKTAVEEICDTAEEEEAVMLLTLLHTLLLLTSWPTLPTLAAAADMSDLEAEEVAAAALLVLAGVLGAGEAATEQEEEEVDLTTETAGEGDTAAGTADTPPAPEMDSVLFWPADPMTRRGEGEDGATLEPRLPAAMEAGDRDQVTLHLGEDEDGDTPRPGLEDWLLATSWPRLLVTLAISAAILVILVCLVSRMADTGSNTHTF